MPYELKIAKVIPIFKAKERNQLKTIDPFHCYLQYPKYLKGSF